MRIGAAVVGVGVGVGEGVGVIVGVGEGVIPLVAVKFVNPKSLLLGAPSCQKPIPGLPEENVESVARITSTPFTYPIIRLPFTVALITSPSRIPGVLSMY